MSSAEDWKTFWKEKAEERTSHFEYDRGRSPREKEIESLSIDELLTFIDPKPWEQVFDAGCGTGSNILLLHSKVRRIIGMDYTTGAVERCRKRIVSADISAVELMRGDITDIPIPDSSIDKVLCMSVLQYLDDEQARKAFEEFRRILTGGGTLILHVKNSSSLYLSTLWLAKKIKSLFRKQVKIEYLRPFRWYRRKLAEKGFEIQEFNSLNLFMIEGMPTFLLHFLQKLELRNFYKPFFQTQFVRRHGSDLKIKARINKAG